MVVAERTIRPEAPRVSPFEGQSKALLSFAAERWDRQGRTATRLVQVHVQEARRVIGHREQGGGSYRKTIEGALALLMTDGWLEAQQCGETGILVRLSERTARAWRQAHPDTQADLFG